MTLKYGNYQWILLVLIHKLIRQGEFLKDYSFMDQIRRATLSISSNITEGFERNNNSEFARYLVIAKGSCGEVRSQLLGAERVGYISSDECKTLVNFCLTLSRKIGSLIQYLKQCKSEGKI